MSVEVTTTQPRVEMTPSGPEIVSVGLQGPPGTNGTIENLIVGETPSGIINGSNATFTTQFPFVPESVEVFLNGLAQRKPDHFNTTGTNTINLSDSPTLGESIQVNYLRT